MREIAKIEYSLIKLKCITYDGKRHTALENTLRNSCLAIAGVISLFIWMFVPIDLPWLHRHRLLDLLTVWGVLMGLHILVNFLLYILLKFRLSRR